MFCKDLSYPLVLRNLIIFAFVTTFGDPNSNGLTTVSRWAKCPDHSVVRYSFPYSLGWSCEGHATYCLYIWYMYNGHKVYICQAWPSWVVFSFSLFWTYLCNFNFTLFYQFWEIHLCLIWILKYGPFMFLAWNLLVVTLQVEIFLSNYLFFLFFMLYCLFFRNVILRFSWK